MDIKQANREIEKLENDYEYYLQEKEQILSLVSVSATQPKDVVVKGGTRIDKFVKYVELEEEKQINATLEYIHQRKQNLLNWIDEELKIMLKYGEVESAIIQLKENKLIKDKNTGKYRNMTWEEISKEVHWSKSFCRNVYRRYKRKRNI